MAATSALFGTQPQPDGWQERAACKRTPVELFFSLDEQDQREALQLCRNCPVQQDCLEFAITHGESYGIWGATRESERRGLIRERRRRAREAARRHDAA